ncbi:MAG TPA: 2-C-methyl-D-erythritol 2,4-cyclodiphosphate synthase [Syntrophaceae bacterium]|jgi:2-C-methyl-D-erythritol 2,4-cyclodiphosphate synthase|nr:2-C-methyl-D-erythritol 2,4-cyclodiphosphate synthase [Syntrophaceae bacterium]
MRIGIGYDSHRLVEGRRLILGGIEIPHDKGLLGHSDADVLVHAVCDAILGALGAGDIGRHFPDTNPAYKGISSMILLQKVYAMVEEMGFRVHNVDSTVILERPRLKRYMHEMALNISKALNISEDRVNVKAKTNEGMGFIGRDEGIAAFAVVTIRDRECK